MKRFLRATLVAALAVVGMTQCGPMPEPTNSRAHRFAQTLDAFVASVPVAGVAAGVVTTGGPAGVTSWYGAAGAAAPGRALTDGDSFRIASVTKTFTAALVLRLAEDGAIDLDAPAARWVANVPAYVTVRHLLSHTSGLADYLSLMPQLGYRMDVRYAPSQLVAIALSAGAAAPGSFSYSNTNFIVLGMIVEAATHQRFDQALRARILQPAGLTSTYLEGFEEGPVVEGTQYACAGFADVSGVLHPTVAWSAGGLVSTTHDLVAWFEALFVQRRVLSAASLQAMTTPAYFGSPYGLGMEVGNPCGGGAPVVWHDGSTPAGFCAFVAYQPSAGFFVSVLSNSHTASCQEVQELACKLASEM